MANERVGSEDARGGDVIVNDSIASGKPALPIDLDPGRDANVAITGEELGAREPKRPGPDRQRTRDGATSGELRDGVNTGDE
jgi:hypothetical protein